jgi:hypothetical protein
MQSVQLSIPKPCHENWDKMTSTQQGRFCNACAKQVVDFTTMSDGEVLKYFLKNKAENICGRTLPQQLNRVLEAPKPITPSKLWYWKYAAAAGLLFFAKGQGVNAQSVTPYTPQQMNTMQNGLVGKVGEIAVINNKVISGKITDEEGAAIPFASVKIVGINRGVSADVAGNYTIRIPLSNNFILVSAAGFVDNKIDLSQVTNYNVELVRNNNFTNGEIVVKVEMVRRKRISCYGTVIKDGQEEKIKDNLKDSLSQKAKKDIPDSSFDNKILDEVIVESNLNRRINCRLVGLMTVITYQQVEERKHITDTLKQKILNLFSHIKVCPNPVQKGQAINISFSSKYNSYTIQVVNASGVVVLQQRRQNGFIKSDAFSKKVLEQITISPLWSSGYYLVNILNEQGKVIAKDGFLVL